MKSRFTTGLGRGCARFVVKRPDVAAILALVVLAVLAGGIGRLEINTGYRGLFHADDPLLRDIEVMNHRHGSGDELIVMLRAADGDILDRAGLTAIIATTRAFEALPETQRVASLTTQRRVTRTAIGAMRVNLVPVTPPRSQAGLDQVRRNVLTTPGAVGTLVTEAGDAVLIRVEIKSTDTGRATLARFMRRVTKLKHDIVSADPDLSVALGGLVALNHAFVEATEHDARRLFPAMAILLCVGLFLFTRSARGVVGPLIVVIAAVLAALGAAGWLRLPVTPILSIAPTIILGIGIADSLHVLVGADRARRGGHATGSASHLALYRALRRNLSPMSLTTVTTGVGFLSLMFSDSPPFRDLGLVIAIGVFAALFFTVTLLPAISLIAPGRARARHDRLGAWIGDIIDLAWRRRGGAALMLGILIAVAGIGLTQMQSDDRLSEWFGESLDFRRDADAITAAFGATERTSWSIPLPSGAKELDTSLLDQLDRFSTWLNEQPEVRGVHTLSSALTNLTGSPKQTVKILGLNRLLRSESGHARLLGLLSRNLDETRIIVTLASGSTRAHRRLVERAGEWARGQAGPINQARPSGPAWSLATLVDTSARTMLFGTLVAFLSIAICLGLLLRSWRLGLVGLTAMVVPPALVYGVWSWIGRPIGLAESVVAATSLGLLVDFSIHILTRYDARAFDGLEPRLRVRRAFEAAGPALLVGFLILIAGFAVLTLSPFRGNMHFGLLTAATLAVGLPVAVLTLPFGLGHTLKKDAPPPTQSTTMTSGSPSS